jgi:hypothetical protein
VGAIFWTQRRGAGSMALAGASRFSTLCAQQSSRACRQPFGNQPDDSPVANPMLDETDQPFPADLIEKGLNVAVEHPVDPPKTSCMRGETLGRPISMSTF